MSVNLCTNEVNKACYSMLKTDCIHEIGHWTSLVFLPPDWVGMALTPNFLILNSTPSIPPQLNQ